MLPERDEPHRDCARRYQEGHQHHIGRARPLHDGEEDDIGDGRAENRQHKQSDDHAPAWKGQLPRPVEKEHDGREDKARAQELAAGACDGRLPAEAPAPDAGKAVAERCPKHGDLGKRACAGMGEGLGAHQDCHAADAEQHAGKLARLQLLIGREDMREHEREERRGRIEDRGEPCPDLLLSPEDQAERDDVVEQPHQQVGTPVLGLGRESTSRYEDIGQENGCGEQNPDPDDDKGRQLQHRDAPAQEGAAPDHGEQQEEAPLDGSHAELRGCGGC